MSDAVLLQYLHDELDADQRGRVEAQLAAAPALAHRLDAMRRRSDNLSGLLRALDPEPADVAASEHAIRPLLPEHSAQQHVLLTHASWWRRSGTVLRAAAVITLLLGTVLLVEPARAWVLERARDLAESLGLVEEMTPAAAVRATQATDNTGTADNAASALDAPARFTVPWTSSTFEVDAGTVAGTLIVVRGPEGVASAEVAAGDAAITFVPRGIRIDGAGSVDAVHSLVLPPSVRTVRVTHAGRTITHALDGDELRLPLRR